ncbi:MAG: zinc ribbon domain-containing protein [Candidatus Omnitrophica bacterium]|nr:zinc ribbon domain-containing protein [Candidatus Omnitrophota bacterium]
MPTYEYECQACGHVFEELQAMTDAKLTKCPKCRKSKLVRLLGSGSGMIFKGSGFYETDYKKKSAPAPAKKETPKSDSTPHSCCSGCPHKK